MQKGCQEDHSFFNLYEVFAYMMQMTMNLSFF